MLVFTACWNSYEEGELVEIKFEEGKYLYRRSGHNVYCGDYDNEEEVTEEEAFQVMCECESWDDLEM